jgi:hypothetical protein
MMVDMLKELIDAGYVDGSDSGQQQQEPSNYVYLPTSTTYGGVICDASVGVDEHAELARGIGGDKLNHG